MKEELIRLLKQVIALLLLQAADLKRQLLYKYAKSCIGKDMSPIQNEYGCAEAVNNVCKLALGFEVGGGMSTYQMYEALKKSTNFKNVVSPLPGDIVLSPSFTGSGRLECGHVGIVSDNNKIMSNSSYSFKWEENYTLGTWHQRYSQVGGFPVLYYRLI